MGCGEPLISKRAVRTSRPHCATGLADTAVVSDVRWVLVPPKTLYRTSDEFSGSFLATGRRRL